MLFWFREVQGGEGTRTSDHIYSGETMRLSRNLDIITFAPFLSRQFDRDGPYGPFYLGDILWTALMVPYSMAPTMWATHDPEAKLCLESFRTKFLALEFLFHYYP